MQIKKLPNQLTVLRMLLVIPFLILLIIAWAIGLQSIAYGSGSSRGQAVYFSAVLIFILAMFTDFIDGRIARKYQAITTFGKLFDPLADKIMTTSALILLGVAGAIPAYLIIILILRDILVDGFRNLIAKHNADLSAITSAKWKTMFLTIGIMVVFFFLPIVSDEPGKLDWFNPNWVLYLANIPVFIATAFALHSGYLYFKQIRKYL